MSWEGSNLLFLVAMLFDIFCGGHSMVFLIKVPVQQLVCPGWVDSSYPVFNLLVYIIFLSAVPEFHLIKHLFIIRLLRSRVSLYWR